ncbi:hypothetical protein SAMN05428979_4157 [Stappia sp. ES.058]|nr:hypothetical protein SAMN05428979_4157 [Stappia sp. ES.058]
MAGPRCWPIGGARDFDRSAHASSSQLYFRCHNPCAFPFAHALPSVHVAWPDCNRLDLDHIRSRGSRRPYPPRHDGGSACRIAKAGPLVVRFRHLPPRTAPPQQMSDSREPLDKYMILLDLLNLKFDREPRPEQDSNVKFAPLASRRGDPAKRQVYAAVVLHELRRSLDDPVHAVVGEPRIPSKHQHIPGRQSE